MTASTPRGLAATSRHRLAPALALSLVAASLSACASTRAPAIQASLPPPAPANPPALPPAPQLVAAGPEMSGIASWYAPGRGMHRTCTGAAFTRSGMTAASHTIPLGTQVRVTLPDEQRSVVVVVNDCMPRNHRLLDLSEGAAKQLGIMRMGVAQVTVTPVMVQVAGR